jgi:UDP-3-O-[3-hydroxymyristoyl] N-acetylglucosamine deacetylase
LTQSSSGNSQTQDHWQKTIAQPIELGGIGVHSGRFIEVVIRPAPANHGIVFLRSDIGGTNAYIPATVDYAVPHNLCTRIENEDGIGVNTIEHFMAAFHGLEIDNLLVEIDGPEMPILDGSATPIFRMLKAAGIEQQDSLRAVMTIVKEIELDLGDGVRACLSPCDHLEIDVSIHFDDHLIGTQAMSYINNSAAFEAELADARTFCMLKDVEAMRNAGMARGGSLDNAVVVHNGSILNDGGLRSADEFVRHKTLDCLGDLYLLGMSLKARLTTNKPGHALSTKLLKALMASPDSFCVEKPNDDLPVNRQWAYPESAVAARS